MKYFNDYSNIAELRKLFRQYCLELHPDKEGGNHEAFIEMKAEYEKVLHFAASNEAGRACAENREPAFNFESESELAAMVEKLMKVQGIIIEICGSWLWVSGNTFPVHEQLKEFGLKYSRNKKRWYFSPYMTGGKRKGRYTMNKIRETFGSTVIESEVDEKLIAA
jgi:hypothetical protein